MSDPPPELRLAADVIVARVRPLMANRDAPILVALDGGSGSGKSTIAARIAEELGAALVVSDDFFAADITDAEWDSRNAAMRASGAIDWGRLRTEALEPLLSAKPAKWHAFDFEAGVRKDGTYAMRADFVECEPRGVIVVEGAYSCRPELADLIEVSVLVDAPIDVRHERLATRAKAYHGLVKAKQFLDSWHARWDSAEEYYFTHIRPKSSFDLVVVNAATAPRRHVQRRAAFDSVSRVDAS